MPDIWVQSLGQEDPLEEEMATHSSILARKINFMNSIISKFFFLTPNSGSFTQLSNRHLHIDISKLLKMKLPNLNSPCFRSILAP